MSVMENPTLLWRSVGKWTAILTAVGVGASLALGAWRLGVGMLLGVGALGWAIGFFVLITRFFAPQQNPLFPRLLMLSNPLKYPMLLVFAYLAVRGGEVMTIGFAIGVALPLAVITGLAIREAFTTR